MTATIQTLARDLEAAFVKDIRTNGERFYKLADGSPEWMRDAICAAHDNANMLPDDWRYSAIRAVAGEIAETDEDSDLDDEAGTRCDSLVDVYNARLCAWLASHLSRIGYCDEASEEYGFDKERGIVGLMQMGQYAEYREIWDSLVSSLTDELDSRPPEQWVTGCNMPGFMPDSDPSTSDSWEEARDALVDDIERAESDAETGENTAAAMEAVEALQSLAEGEEFGRTVGAYHYWLTRATD